MLNPAGVAAIPPATSSTPPPPPPPPSGARPVEPATVLPGRWLTLVPVEVFGGDCACHERREAGEGKTDCHGWSYGLCDAVEPWSDCNRAAGRIFRVEDLTGPRRPGESIRVWVADDDVPALTQTIWGDPWDHRPPTGPTEPPRATTGDEPDPTAPVPATRQPAPPRLKTGPRANPQEPPTREHSRG